MTLERLIKRSVNGIARERAEQQGANGPVSNDCQITFRVFGNDFEDGPLNTCLCIDSPFPAANARIGICEEGVGHAFEFCRRKKARGAAVIFTEVFRDPDTLS